VCRITFREGEVVSTEGCEVECIGEGSTQQSIVLIHRSRGIRAVRGRREVDILILPRVKLAVLIRVWGAGILPELIVVLEWVYRSESDRTCHVRKRGMRRRNRGRGRGVDIVYRRGPAYVRERLFGTVQKLCIELREKRSI